MPLDLIPDFLPIIGHLDDSSIVPGLVVLALKWVPPKSWRIVARKRRAPTSIERHFA